MEGEILSERKLQILYNAVEDYIQFANPITSGSVHKKYVKNISPATLRNELSALEAMGYLKQLHTSGGRIPTTKAYRLYVNNLMGTANFNKKALESVRAVLTQRTVYLNDVVQTIAGVVSNATNYPTVVILNGYDNLPIESIKIIPLIDLSALLLIGTKNGIVNGQFALTDAITEETCIDASNLLTKKFAGKTIKFMRENIKEQLKDISQELEGFKMLFNNLIDCLSGIVERQKNVVRSGQTKLLNNPEYTDLEDAKKVLSTIDNDFEIEEVYVHRNEILSLVSSMLTFPELYELADEISLKLLGKNVDFSQIKQKENT